MQVIKIQKGFTLLEMSIVTALMAVGILATIQMNAAQSQREAAKSVAEGYERLSNAAGSYMSMYYKTIINNKDKAACGILPYSVGGIPAPAITSPGFCKINLQNPISNKTFEVQNFLQPTPLELATLGFLPQPASDKNSSLPFSTYLKSTTDTTLHTFRADGGTADNGFSILIQLICIGDTTVKDPVTSANVCQSSPVDLRSLVFNKQPYSIGGDQSTVLYQVLESSGGKGYLSDLRLGGELHAKKGSVDGELKNPLRLSGNGGVTGAPYVLAFRNGYASSGNDLYVRADGSVKLTSAWNVGGQSILGIDNLSAASGTFSGEISAASGTFSGNVSAVNGGFSGNVNAASVTTGSVLATGGVTGGFGVFGNVTDGVGSALRAATAFIQNALSVGGSLTVAGVTNLNGGANLSGVTKVSQLRLDSEAVLGSACNPANETLRRAASNTTNNLRLLVCDPGTNTWRSPQRDYQSEITNITTTVQTQSEAIAALQGGVAKLQDEYMNWDIININWSKAVLVNASTSPPTWRASSYVWKRTPWLCNELAGGQNGGLTPWSSQDANGRDAQIRWEKNASEFQKNTPGAVYTPPIFVGFDDVVNDNIVYDINCEIYNRDGRKYWWVGVSAKRANERNGNKCRSGLGSQLDSSNATMSTYNIRDPFPDSSLSNCQNFNILAPNFAPESLAARFISFTKKNP